MKTYMAWVILLWTACTFVCHAQAEIPIRKIENQSFDLFDTGLGVSGCCDLSTTGIWLNNDLFAMSSMKDSPDAIEKKSLQVMLVDFKTKTSRILVDTGQLVCWNPERKIASIQKTYTSFTEDVKYDLIHLDAQGRAKKLIDKKDINPHLCQSEASLAAREGSLSILLRESDGYIQKAAQGASFQYDKLAIWMRPGKAPLNLNLRVDEIYGASSNIGNYLAYSKKYLLNTWDSQGGATDGVVSRSYGLMPYRLMALDGSIEEMPYPKIIFEYGIKSFGLFLPTPVGVLISTNHLFLLQGEKLTRIWPRPNLFGLVAYEMISDLVLSPDGCKVAVRHFPDTKGRTLPITILNLCQKA